MRAQNMRPNRYELTPDVEERIIDFFKKSPRDYVFCGEVAVHVHNNLDWTSKAIEDMVIRGILRSLTPAEKKAEHLDKDAQVFVYIHPAQK